MNDTTTSVILAVAGALALDAGEAHAQIARASSPCKGPNIPMTSYLPTGSFAGGGTGTVNVTGSAFWKETCGLVQILGSISITITAGGTGLVALSLPNMAPALDVSFPQVCTVSPSAGFTWPQPGTTQLVGEIRTSSSSGSLTIYSVASGAYNGWNAGNLTDGAAYPVFFNCFYLSDGA